jgi:hypothetical protein
MGDWASNKDDDSDRGSGGEGDKGTPMDGWGEGVRYAGHTSVCTPRECIRSSNDLLTRKWESVSSGLLPPFASALVWATGDGD